MKRLVWLIVPLAVVVGAILSWPRAHGPAPLVYGRDACARCRMPLSRAGFGGELRGADGQLRPYDDVGCLLQSIHGPTEAWVEDHAGGGLVPLTRAHFVVDAEPTPMGYGIVAFGSEEVARAFALKKGGRVMTLEAVLHDSARFGALSAKKPGARPLDDRDASAGKKVYVRECAGCHGERADGNGPAAAFLDPKPRDFTKRMFKLRTTDSGQPPATADVLRTIERGLPGSAMPSFAFLTPEERKQAAAYVLDKAEDLDDKEPATIPDPGDGPPTTAQSIARGKEIYAKLQCFACHGPLGKGDGPSAAGLRDDAGNPIKVRDFTGGVFRGGGDRKDLYYRFVTGMDGTPMPAFGEQIQGDDRWALVDYVLSLKVPQKPQAYPADPIAAGRQLVAKYGCRGCHVVDDGVGGDVGPDLRVSGQKLGPQWVRTFLHDPRAWGKIYMWRAQRMPRLALTDEEVEVAARYLMAMGKRRDEPLPLPDPSRFSSAQLEEGKNFFLLRCTQCHTLGDVIVTPTATQQGPDLARVAGRVDFNWARRWIYDPHKIDPKTRMTIPGITQEQVDAVRAFVWKTAMEQQAAHAAATPPTGSATAAR